MKHQPWTDQDTTLLKQLYCKANVSINHLRQILNRSEQAIHHKASSLGIHRPSTVWKQHDAELLSHLYPNPNVSAHDMEKTFNRTWTAIKIKANKMNLLRPRRNRYNAKRNYFQSINTDLKAYLLGLIAADGTIINKNGQYGVNLMLQFRDVILINRLKDEIGRDIPITTNRSTFSVTICSKEMCEDLAVYGVIPRKSKNFQWPSALPEHFAIPFILGYFDGDGTLCRIKSKYNYWLWELIGCQAFLQNVKERVEASADVKINGPVRTHKDQSPHLYQINSGSQHSIVKIDATLNASGLSLPRKHF